MAVKIGPDRIVDGVFRDTLSLEDGKVWRHREQLDRPAILRANATLRRSEANKMDGMRWALRIPEDDYAGLVKRNPALQTTDRGIRDKAWAKFLASDESLPYRVYEPTGRGRTA